MILMLEIGLRVKCELVINPQTRTVVSANPTSTRKAFNLLSAKD